MPASPPGPAAAGRCRSRPITAPTTRSPQRPETSTSSRPELDGANETPGQRNLYRYSNGAVHFITTLFGRDDQPDPSVAGWKQPRDRHRREPDPAVDRRPPGDVPHRPGDRRNQVRLLQPRRYGPVLRRRGQHERAFYVQRWPHLFLNSDSLAPQDTNGLIDSYEFVDNRPQLLLLGHRRTGRWHRFRRRQRGRGRRLHRDQGVVRRAGQNRALRQVLRRACRRRDSVRGPPGPLCCRR